MHFIDHLRTAADQLQREADTHEASTRCADGKDCEIATGYRMSVAAINDILQRHTQVEIHRTYVEKVSEARDA